VTRSLKIIVAVFAFMSSGILLAQSEMILEDINADAKRLKRYGKAEDVVNAIQRDPFYRLLDGLNDKDHPITDYDVSEFTLVGTVWDVPTPIAMFKGPRERRYVVKVGDKIGKNTGVVVNIEQGQVLIKETYTDLNKNKIEKSTIKRVGKPV